MGRNGQGPIWLWADLVMDRNDQWPYNSPKTIGRMRDISRQPISYNLGFAIFIIFVPKINYEMYAYYCTGTALEVKC